MNASKQKKIGGLPTVVETRRDCGGGPENPETGQPAPQLIGFDFVIAIGMSIMTHGSMEDRISVGNLPIGANEDMKSHLLTDMYSKGPSTKYFSFA